MNRLIIPFCALALLAVACSSAKKQHVSTNTKDDFMPSPDRKFDIETFNKNKNESDYRYFTDNDVFEVVQFYVGDGKGFVESRRNPKELFEEYYTYYENGDIKQEARRFRNKGFFKGNGYFYDLTGELTEVINYDVPYKYTWEDVLKFGKKHKINLYDTCTYITRYYNKKEGYCWDIAWKAPSDPMVSNVVILSGEDGRILMQRIDSFEE